MLVPRAGDEQLHRPVLAEGAEQVELEGSEPLGRVHDHPALAAWQTRNSKGRLIRKEGPRQSGNYTSPGYFTLHEADFGSRNTIVMRIHRSFGLDSDLTFMVLERPALGSVRIFDRAGSSAELVHLADNREAAAAWLSEQGYPNAVLEDVTADEVAASHVEGRAAA